MAEYSSGDLVESEGHGELFGVVKGPGEKV